MIEYYTYTEKAYALTARTVLSELSDMLEEIPGRCGKMCEDCPMVLKHNDRRPDCLFDLVLSALMKIEEGK